MTSESFLPVVWRRKWIVVATTVLLVAVTYAYASTQEKVYVTSTKLLIAQPGDTQSFDAVQAAQVAARTYGSVLTSPNLAAEVSEELGGTPSPGRLEKAVSAEPIPETQLLRLKVEANDAELAKRIADTYAEVFTAHVRRELTPVTKVTLTVADAATVPRGPARPKPRLYAAVAFVLGLALGLALAALRERLDHRLRTVDDLEGLVGAPVLARIPRRSRGEASAAFTEAFRVLRTNLQFALPDGVLRTIAVTSHDPVEGKSTTVSQLARVSASTGNDVLVVESDIKRPSQQAFFRPDATERLSPGLTTFIVGGASLERCVHPTGIPGVGLVPAGPPVPSLSGLLESARGREVLDQLAEAADLVIFDCPPLTVGADAATIAGRVDGVVLVVDMERATRDTVREALRQLQGVRAQVLGVVANRDPSVEESTYGYGESTPERRSAPARMNLQRAARAAARPGERPITRPIGRHPGRSSGSGRSPAPPA